MLDDRAITAMAGADLAPLRLSAAEAGHLAWLLDGPLSEPEVAAALRRSRGLCPRHAWGLAALDAELHGGIVYDTAALIATLLAQAARASAGLHLLGARAVRERLSATKQCMTCDHLRRPHAARAHTQVSEFPHFIALLDRALPGAHACPACLDGDGPPCRPHIISGALPGRRFASHLAGLAHALADARDALLADVCPLTDSEAAAWICGLGWLAGWGFAALASDAAGRERDGRASDAILER